MVKSSSMLFIINNLRQISRGSHSHFLKELATLIFLKIINKSKFSGPRVLKIIFYCLSYPCAACPLTHKSILFAH